MQVDWFPIDAALARQRDSEPGAVGTDDIDEMEEPAQSVRGDFWGFDAAGRVLVWGGGVVRAVPDPGAGEPQVVASPSDTSALPFPGGRLDFSESSRFVWTPDGGQRQVHAVMSRLPNTAVIEPGSLNWFSRDGLLVATGSDWDGGDLIGAVWRWRLPDCTPLPVLTVPGTRRLFAVGELLFAAAIPPQEPPEEGGPRGMRLDLLTWGPEATPGPGLPFARLPEFPSLVEVRCDATSVWQRSGQRWSRFALADGTMLPASGEPPPRPQGAEVPYEFEEPTDYSPKPSPEQRFRRLAHNMHPHVMHQHSMGRPFRWSWIAHGAELGWYGTGPVLRLFVPVVYAEGIDFRRVELRGHDGVVLDAALTPDRRHLVTVGSDGIAALWRLPATLFDGSGVGEPELLAQRLTTPLGGWLVMTPEGFYSGTREAIDGVQARRGNESFPAAQVELSQHRPDLVQARIGLVPPARIAALRRAWELRLRRQGLDAARLASAARPEARFAAALPLRHDGAVLAVPVVAEQAEGGIQRILVTVSGVPVPDRHGLGRGRDGVRADAEGRRLEATVAVPLAHGSNIIEVTAVGRDGLEGPLRRAVVDRPGTAAPRLIVAAVGVSRYARGEYDLRHAASDAERAARTIAALPGFAAAEVHLVRDAEASRDGILALRQRLAASGPDDLVVLFLAGHGVLDERQDWWFLTHAGDPEQPAAGCVAYHEIEGLFDGIPAQRRLLLMDACHAGEVDAAATVPGPGVAVRAVRGLKRVTSTGSAEDAALMRDIFIDLRRAAGAVVIAASAGQEVAYEDDRWQGGAFTRALLDSLADPAADRDGDRRLSALEWRAATAERVAAMTGGVQRPVQRADNHLAEIILRSW
jgi:hypothetical protein